MNRFYKNITQNAFVIVLICNLIFFLLYIHYFSGGFSISNSDWGSFGSFVGGTMAPIVGILTIILTYSILNNQNKEFSQAEFRFMFEKLFNSIQEQFDSIKFEKGNNEFKGKEAVIRLNKDFYAVIEFLERKEKKKLSNNEIDKIDYSKIAQKAFWSVYNDVNGCFATYMKNIHNCLKVIDTYCEETHKNTYSDLLRAQFDGEDMQFFLYNSVCFGDFKKRIEKYTLLQDINNTDKVHKGVIDLFKKSAFKSKST